MFWTAEGEIYNEDELATKVETTVRYYRTRCEELEEELKDWRKNAATKANKELIDKIQYLEDRLSRSYGEFASEKELKAYNDFENRHIHDRLTSRYNGGRAPYLIPTGTGIGTILHVKCPICGEEEDITDNSVW